VALAELGEMATLSSGSVSAAADAAATSPVPAPVWGEVAAKLTLADKSYGENDEGDYDYYSIFELQYGGQSVWLRRERRSSNVSGAWGSQLNATLSPDGRTLLVRVTNVRESIGRSENTKGSEERLSVFDLLVKAGVLTEEETTACRGSVAAAADITPSSQPELGSTWQLHNDPFA
jgi:hypothetical protein